MLFLKQPFILPVLCHKSATICQIDSYKVSNSKLKPDLCNCVKTEIIESTVPPRQPHKRGAIFFATPCRCFRSLQVQAFSLAQTHQETVYPVSSLLKTLYCQDHQIDIFLFLLDLPKPRFILQNKREKSDVSVF